MQSSWRLVQSSACWLLLACSHSPVATRSGSLPASDAAGTASSATAPTASAGTLGNLDNPTANITGTGGFVAPSTTICAPGHYVGNFFGNYRAAAWFNGATPINFSTSDSNGKPGFEFWLEAVTQPCPPNSEFCPEAVVKGGKLRGFAAPFTDTGSDAGPNPFQLSVRFEIDLTGELDCSAGQFRGQLQNGCYDVLSVLYRFSGTLMSSYDQANSAFTNGTWNVTEMPMANSMPAAGTTLGGSGMWNAKLEGPGMSPDSTGMGLCDGMSGFDTPMQ